MIKNNQSILISGHKHSFVQIVSAAIILNQPCKITNVPDTDDVVVLKDLIEKLGGRAQFIKHTFSFDPTNMQYRRPDARLCAKIHGSLYFIFALAIRFNRFAQLKTGGCQIGKEKKRPDSHLITILNSFGTLSPVNDKEFIFMPSKNKRITQNIVDFSDSLWRLSGEKVSSATKLCILAALNNKKETVIKNYYFRTDVMDLLNFIRQCGISVKQSGKKLKIIPTQPCNHQRVTYRLSDCQSEVITFITLAIMCNISLTLKVQNIDILCQILKPELNLFKNMNVNITFSGDKIIIPRNQTIKSADVKITQKGIQSDHQPFLALLLTNADGQSSITENVWKTRFGYVSELNKLGTNIQMKNNKITIYPTSVAFCNNPRKVSATDTRAAAVLTIAALATKSNITIRNAEHLNRGYDGFLQKLIRLGANITQ